MNLRVATNDLNNLKNQLEYWLNKREIEFQKTQVQATDYSKDKVSGGESSNTFDEYVSNIEHIDNKIKSIKEEIRIISDYINKEVNRISKYDSAANRVIMLRETKLDNGRPMAFYKIAMATGYSERQCKRIYYKYKNGTKCP